MSDDSGVPQAAADSGVQNAIELYTALRACLTLVEDMLILARQGLERNPSPEERRELDRQILDLEEQRARIDNKMTVLLAEGTAAQPPSEAQVQSIAELTGKVEEQTNQAAAASMAIVLAGEVIDLAKGIAAG